MLLTEERQRGEHVLKSIEIGTRVSVCDLFSCNTDDTSI